MTRVPGGVLAAMALATAGPAAWADPCAPQPADTVMFNKLTPTCVGCHLAGTLPFFASLTAFENLIVGNTKYVVPGHPEQSYLVALLKGAGQGTYKQMPLNGETFEQLDAAGKTQISLQAVEDWITQLTTPGRASGPSPSAPSIQRMTAEQMRTTLYAQLGLSTGDFFGTGTSYGTLELITFGPDRYPIYSTDEEHGVDTPDPTFRHGAMGGLQTLAGRPRDPAVAVPFALALQPVSQAWCKLAIAKPSSLPLLFPDVAPTATSAAAAADIKKNIGYLALHFLGDPATPEEVDAVFTNVFVPIESASDPRTAWAGVCSYFIRHPKWVFY